MSIEDRITKSTAPSSILHHPPVSRHRARNKRVHPAPIALTREWPANRLYLCQSRLASIRRTCGLAKILARRTVLLRTLVSQRLRATAAHGDRCAAKRTVGTAAKIIRHSKPRTKRKRLVTKFPLTLQQRTVPCGLWVSIPVFPTRHRVSLRQ